ncbi:MAG: hypothetical protein V3V40_06370 [Nitrosomonadaceae bacterium]
MPNKYKKGSNITTYGQSSRKNINSCHDNLQIILFELARDGWNITVVDGYRDEERQTEVYNSGSSGAEWPDSDHNVSPSNAVDIAPYIPGVGIPWENCDNLWIILAGAFMSKAQELNIEVEWGGLYKGLKDLGHFSLIT